jgi:hypothetical protein
MLYKCPLVRFEMDSQLGRGSVSAENMDVEVRSLHDVTSRISKVDRGIFVLESIGTHEKGRLIGLFMHKRFMN